MARKNSLKQERLDARAAQIRAQADAERRRTYVIIAVFAVLVIGGAGLLYFLVNPPSFGGTRASSTAVKKVGAVQTVTDEGRGHVARPTRVSYKHQPPSSGDHYSDAGAPRPWGAVQTELLPEEYIHNLEHGGIVLVYQCTSDCDADFKAAQALFAQLPKDTAFNEVKFLSTPYQEMKPQAALLAWDHEQDFTGIPSLSDATAFYQQFVDQAPEKIQ